MHPEHEPQEDLIDRETETQERTGALTSVLWDERKLDQLKERYGESSIVRVTRFKDEYSDRSDEEILHDLYMVSEVGIPVLGNGDDENKHTCEVLIAPPDVPVQYGREKKEGFGLIELSRFGNQSLLRLAVPEDLHGNSIQDTSLAAYRELFRMAEEFELGNLVRVWNYVPDVLGRPEEGEESDELQEEYKGFVLRKSWQPRQRYKEFNAGRLEAWKEDGPKNDEGELALPAATGIGAHDGPLVIEAWFTHDDVQYLQNKQQTPPIFYNAPLYGEKPPAFSRGTKINAEGKEGIVIAGTASLLGENIVYNPDAPVPVDTSETEMDERADATLVGQVNTAIDNIEYLLSRDNLVDQGVHENYSLANLSTIRVYIKYPKDHQRVREIVEQRLPGVGAVYIEDDICRDGWLVEIEGMAWHKAYSS
jgi:hypothetical protein